MKKAKASALLPILVFLILFIGFGIITKSFYKMPATVGFLIALLVAFAQNRKLKLDEKVVISARAAGDENIMIMCLVFLFAGAFSGTVTSAGGALSAANLGLSILPTNLAVVGIFLIGCLISISMGTSVGTIAVLAPIAVEMSNASGISILICIGAVISGAMFGDNLSMISDTTIAATRSQGCEMKDKFRENFKIVLPAAIVAIVLYFAFTYKASFDAKELEYSLVKILPYILVLVTAIIGVNVFIVLSGGTLFAIIIGIAYKEFTFLESFGIMGTGMANMFEIAIISIIVSAVFGLIKENGGVEFIINIIRKCSKTKKGAELGIAVMAGALDIATANNTVAIVLSGPIAKEISTEYEIEPKRTASLLDIFASVFQGILPYGFQVMSACAIAEISVIEIIPFTFYPFLMAISAIIFIFVTPKKKVKEEKALPIE